uniref:Uncharacterized protein n=1 Tax=uncultured organism TaxID=155900 RepID=M1P1D4_9ZZZZ|nr:hypothetical protein FLSS-19_0024 [uncultured organism]
MTSKKEFTIPYGKEKIEFKLSKDIEINKIKTQSLTTVENYKEKIRKKLKNPTGTEPLNKIVAKKDDVAIVVSDITRLAYRTHDFLPVLVNELNQYGIKDENIDIVVATGTHQPQTTEEDRKVVGKELHNRLNIHNHDSESENLIDLGTTSRGTEVKINPIVHRADKVILTGGIVYHTLAGFGGGRKSIAPGVISEKAIQQNHGIVLQENGEINPKVRSGKLKNNPVSEDMFEISEIIDPDLILNVIVDGKKEFVDIVAGDLRKSHLKGCRTVQEAFGVPIENKSDLVIASCGGHPKDIQLYQSVKGLFNAAHAVKENGTIILVTKCSQGIGPNKFTKWFNNENPKELAKELNKNFTISGFVALRTAKINQKSPIILLSDLPNKKVRKMGMKPVKNMKQAISKAKKINNQIKTVNLMPNSKLTFPITNEQQKIELEELK